jgi:hypothetical protein
VESGEKALADGFIVSRDGGLAGVGFGLQLMNVVANMQAERNRQIMHSIDYASVIQRSLLRPSDLALSDALADAHLEWQPRDVVGGDFYHFAQYPQGWFAAIADCTGHGVPGAFMTLITSSILTQALQQLGPPIRPPCWPKSIAASKACWASRTPAGSSSSNDGMDAAFLWFDAPAASCISPGQAGLFLLDPDQRRRADHGWRTHGRRLHRYAADYQWHNKSMAIPGQPAVPHHRWPDRPDRRRRDIAYGKRRMRDALLAQRHASAARRCGHAGRLPCVARQQPRRDDLTFFCFPPLGAPFAVRRIQRLLGRGPQAPHHLLLRGLFLAARGGRHFRNHQGAARYGRRGRTYAAPHLFLVRGNVAEHHALLVRHAHAGQESTGQMRRGSFCIGMKDDSFFLLCANPVDSTNVERIRQRLEPLHSMTMEEIKTAYKKPCATKPRATARAPAWAF